MKLTIRVKPNARQNKVEQCEDGSYKVSVTAVADKGLANQATIDALAAHFNVSKSAVAIFSGQSSRIKIINVLDSQ